MPDRADYKAPAWQHELDHADHTDHTDHTDQDISVLPCKIHTWSRGNRVPVRGVHYHEKRRAKYGLPKPTPKHTEAPLNPNLNTPNTPEPLKKSSSSPRRGSRGRGAAVF